MSRILLLFVLKYLLVAICHESNEFYDRNRSKSPWSFSIEESSYLVIEGVPSTSMKDESVKKLRMKLDCIHELVFFIRQKNIGNLTSVLREVSDPSSSKYGQYLSRGEVNSITANPFSEAAVVSFLLSNEVHKVSRSLNGEYVRGSAPIAVWERISQTKFYTYQSSQDPVNVHICDEAVRIESYRIPTKLKEHVNGVFNTVEIPRRSCNGLPRGSTSLGPSSTTDLRSYDQLYTAAWTNADAIKRERDSLLPEHITDDPPRLGGHQDNMASSQPLHDETFSRTATSGQNVPVSTLLNQQTRYWGVETQLVGWLLEMAQTTTHVPVMGLGFSMQESSVSKSEIDAFNALAVKLGCMGVTMVASSSSLQAASNVDESNRGCRDGPVFPSSSPYVTSVNRLEISNYHPMPYWQIPASSSVAASPPFLRTQLRRSLRSDSRHAEGRAYPDFTISVSMQLQDSMSEEHSEANEVEKTCQAAMAIFSNINSARKEAGVGSLGWANPILYAYSDRLFDGVTLSSGDMVSDAEVDGSDSNSVLGVGDGDWMRSLLASVTETEKKKKDGEGCKREKKDGGEGEENDCEGKDKSDGEEKNGDDGGIDENDDDVNDDKPGGNDTKPCQIKAGCSYRQSDPHTLTPSVAPTVSVSHIPCTVPTVLPTVTPTFVPSFLPTVTPTFRPSFLSTATPTFRPSFAPTVPPSDGPSVLPTSTQTLGPVVGTDMPTFAPTCAPTAVPTAVNSKRRRKQPSTRPSDVYPRLTDSVLIVQTFSAVTGLTDGNQTFISSLKTAITAAVDIPLIISMLSVSVPASNRRMLLMDLVTSYRVDTTVSIVPNDFVAKLHASLESEAFLKSMQNNTGMVDLAVTGLQITDVTPTSSPTSSPVRLKVDTVTILLAVAGAIVGAAIIGIAACATIYCCHRSMKHTDPIGPSLDMYALPMGDVVPMGSNPTSTRSLSSYPLAVLAAPTIGVVQNAYVLQDADSNYSSLPLFPSNL